jgi:cell division septation protein DedD
MTERRYGFRFSAVEAGVLVVIVLLVSALIFLSGIYVGQGVEAHRTGEQTAALRMPVNVTPDSRVPVANTPLAWKLSKDKSAESQPPAPPGVEEIARQATSLKAHPVVESQKSLAGKTLAVDALAKEDIEKSEEKPPQTSAKEKLRAVKDPSLQTEMRVRRDTKEGRELAVRTATVQSRPNEELDEAKPRASVPAQREANGTRKWRVQVEATSREEVAREIAQSLRAQGYAPSISRVQREGEVLYRIRVGKFATQDEAVAAIGRFRREGKFSQAYPVSE